MVGKPKFQEALPKDFITAEEFASDVLGFEEYEEGEEDANGGADGVAQSGGPDQYRNTGGAGMAGIQEVPEEEGF